MKIAELFVALGIKGNEETNKGIRQVDKSLKGVVSTGFAVKAGLAAMAFGLQQLMNKSSMAGAAINQFENSTGLSGKKLQQWQYAARQFNVGADEMTGSITSVQDAMTNMLLGKGAPEGFGMVANMVDIDPTKVRDTFYVLEKLQEFAKRVPADVSKSMMKSFGLSDGIIAAMRQGGFNKNAFKQAPIYTAAEADKLRVLNVGWENLGDKISKALGRLNAKHGGQLMKDISSLAEQVLKLVDSFAKLAETLKVFKGVGKVFEGWDLIFGSLNKTADVMEKKGVWETLKAGAEKDFNTIKNILPDNPFSGAEKEAKGSITFQQNLNFKHDGKDSSKTASDVNRATKNAFRQMQAQGQVN